MFQIDALNSRTIE